MSTTIVADAAPRSESRCAHCAQQLIDQTYAPYCCRGCRTVHGILSKAGLTRYYDLRQGPGLPPADFETRHRDHKWLEQLQAEDRGPGGTRRVALDIQGVHCTACVWLVEELFRRHDGERLGKMSINPALGRIDLVIGDAFRLEDWVSAVEDVGYSLGRAAESPESKRSDDLLLRVGICGALAANVMLFAAAVYVGLRDGPVYELLNQLSYAAGVLAVLVGGSVFIGSAARALRHRVLHLDVPIALGILLAFAGSTWSFLTGSGHAAYMDTLTVFVALMLLGRWLQERMLERNRALLLADAGAEGLLTRRIVGGVAKIVHCVSIRSGDELLVASGDLVPVDLRITAQEASCSLDWIDGESTPRTFPTGSTVPAGAFNVGTRAFRGIAATDFSASSVVVLAAGDTTARQHGPIATRWWSRLARIYVIVVIGLASIGFTLWAWLDGPLRAIEVATAVLVVTCPCAFGIAAPLAYELVLNRLRSVGVFVRVADFLDRLRGVTRVVFDKTGTLTTGVLSLENATNLQRLPPAEITVLYNMVARSSHPKSVAIRRALEGLPAAHIVALDVEERPGEGLAARHRGHAYQLGGIRTVHDVGADPRSDVELRIDGRVVGSLHTREELRPGAPQEVAQLRASGYTLAILSGDAQRRVSAIGRELGLREDACIGGQSPEQKADFVRTHDPARTLLIGDGLNDRVAMGVAACSGTPAVDRPFMASRCDFYFVSPGLRPVTQVLRSADHLAQLIRRILIFAVGYNLLAVSLAMAGLMEPWVAAVLMPLSSLLTLAYTTASLSKGVPWRS